MRTIIREHTHPPGGICPGCLDTATAQVRALESDLNDAKQRLIVSESHRERAEVAEARFAEAERLLKAVVRHKRPGDGQLVQIPIAVWIQVRDFFSRSPPERESGVNRTTKGEAETVLRSGTANRITGVTAAAKSGGEKHRERAEDQECGT